MTQTPLVHAEESGPAPESSQTVEPACHRDPITVGDCRPDPRIEFDVQAELDETCKQTLQRDLSSLLGHYQCVEDRAEKVIISRPTSDPRDRRIIAIVKSRYGVHLGSIVGEENGMGALFFDPPAS